MKYRYLWAFVFIFLLPLSLFAGITGKIRGKITDNADGSALPGVNVLIEGQCFQRGIDAQFIGQNLPALFILPHGGVVFAAVHEQQHQAAVRFFAPGIEVEEAAGIRQSGGVGAGIKMVVDQTL